jgi:hypothetical protein
MVKFTKVIARIAGTALVLLTGIQNASAYPVTYHFDSFDDLTSITNQIASLTFGRTTVLKAGFSLNEIAFPPRSGENVVFDDGGAITIDFATPVLSAGGYFNYLAALTLSAYDSSNNLLGTDVGDFVSNIGDGTGDPGSGTNEFLGASSAAGLISRVVIESSQAGGSFTMDDLTVDAANNIPEPATLALMLGMLGAGCLRGGWLRRNK